MGVLSVGGLSLLWHNEQCAKLAPGSKHRQTPRAKPLPPLQLRQALSSSMQKMMA